MSAQTQQNTMMLYDNNNIKDNFKNYTAQNFSGKNLQLRRQNVSLFD